MSANVENMFSTRVKPWHELGTVVNEAPDSQTALRLAGLESGTEGCLYGRRILYSGIQSELQINRFPAAWDCDRPLQSSSEHGCIGKLHLKTWRRKQW